MPLPLFLPCAAGVEALLAEEVARLLPDVPARTARGGVAVVGDPHEVMVLNLESRLAQRVLIEVAEGPYRDDNDLYELAHGVAWSDWITPRQTLRVDTTAQRSPLKSLNFAALRVKDALCDRMRDEHGERPNVDTVRPDLQIVLHAGAERAAIYVDSSGESLFKRGWREDKGDAPLKETLAAAMLAAAGWRGKPGEGGALHDPCCGSGTIAIEAAQIAMGMAPGQLRRFAFERHLPFANIERRAELQRLKSHAAARVHASAVPIFASDVSFRMVDFARRNAERAGVAGGNRLPRRRCARAAAAGAAGRPARNADGQSAIRRTDRGCRQGRGARAPRPPAEQRSRGRERLLPATGGALETRLYRASGGLDRLDPEPRHAPSERDAAEGVASRADVERADRVPAVPLRPRRRIGARPEPELDLMSGPR